jgi:hypothetical protein
MDLIDEINRTIRETGKTAPFTIDRSTIEIPFLLFAIYSNACFLSRGGESVSGYRPSIIKYPAAPTTGSPTSYGVLNGNYLNASRGGELNPCPPSAD